MSFVSPTFVGFILAVALASQALNRTWWRSGILLLASVVFMASQVSEPLQLLPLAGFVLLGYALVEMLRRTRSRAALWIGVTLVLALFIVLKRFSFLPTGFGLPFLYLIAGLSYILFRIIHLMVDAQQGELAQRVPLMRYLNFSFNFLTFTAGPIQRYQDFEATQDQARALDRQRTFEAFARIVKGFVKVAAISAVFEYLFSNLSGRLLDTSLAQSWLLVMGLLIGSAVCYTVYLYANFAGYMDIVIGVGWLLGQDLPENFNQPFKARSFLDFWARWHMTLSEWFKTYLFNPLLRVLAQRFTSAAAAPYLGVAAFFVTFLVMGVWHGTTAVFVVYGLLMGAGASVNKLWQVVATKRWGKKGYKALGERPAVAYLARGLTTAYFALAITCLWVDMPQLLRLVGRLGPHGLLLAYVLLACAAALAYAAWDGICSRWGAQGRGPGWSGRGLVVRHLGLGFSVVLVFVVTSFFHKAPEFVYRAF
jgi:alginate O-acetyltransferase complex protein AlgI